MLTELWGVHMRWQQVLRQDLRKQLPRILNACA